MSSHSLILAALMMSAVAVGAIRSPWAPTAAIEVQPPMVITADFSVIRSTTVFITNALEKKQNLEVHCKDKNSDFGVNEVPFGATYSFSMRPTPFSADYFCSFVFDNVTHWFDIYLWKRDLSHNCASDDTCKWSVYQAGICSTDPRASTECYSWNPPTTVPM